VLHGLDRPNPVGVVQVLLDLAPRIPEAVRRVAGWERRVIDLYRSPQFSTERMRALWGDRPY